MRTRQEVEARIAQASATRDSLAHKPNSHAHGKAQGIVDGLTWALGPEVVNPVPEQNAPNPSMVIEWEPGEGAGWNIAEIRYYLSGDRTDLEDVLREFDRQCGYKLPIIDLCGLTQPVSHPNKFHIIPTGDVDLGYPTGAVGTTQVSVYWSEHWRNEVPYRTTIHAGHTLILWKLLAEKWPKCVIEAHSKVIEAVKKIGRVPDNVVVSDGFNHGNHCHVRPNK